MTQKKKNTMKHRNGKRIASLFRQNRNLKILLAAVLLCAALIWVFFGGKDSKYSVETQSADETGVTGTTQASDDASELTEEAKQYNKTVEKPEITVDLLDINEYSRPGIALEKVNGIVIHYVSNPGTTAKQNRDYFENLMTTHSRKASSHFIVGLDGEIVQCIPTKEWAYATKQRNKDTISIECCHPKADGKFSEKTYKSVVQLTAWLCQKYNLDADDVIRHYDVTGKMCPVYYVNHPKAWEKFRKKVNEQLY